MSMTHFRPPSPARYVLAVMMLAACGDDRDPLDTTTNPTSITSASIGTSATQGGTSDPSGDPSTTAGSTADPTTGATTGATATDPTGGETGTMEAGGPMIVDFGTNVKMLTEGQSVIFTATVIDPDGPDDLQGGSLKSEDGLITYGAFNCFGSAGSGQALGLV